MDILRLSGPRLPDGFEDLAAAAAKEGVRNMALLETAWREGTQRFDQDGAALFGVFKANALAGVGGCKPQVWEGESAMRMHRFYIHPLYRRQGTGRELAQAVMAHALQHTQLLTCNARATDAAAPFWEALRFRKVDAEGVTYIFRIRNK
jgi:GNAT superfamily N-acetyltransferase